MMYAVRRTHDTPSTPSQQNHPHKTPAQNHRTKASRTLVASRTICRAHLSNGVESRNEMHEILRATTRRWRGNDVFEIRQIHHGDAEFG
jgi:aspartate aminotransferase-like enzyme